MAYKYNQDMKSLILVALFVALATSLFAEDLV
jgi:hypothetical protein